MYIHLFFFSQSFNILSKSFSREKDAGPIPLAYDYVPTTEVYERLDELYRMNVDLKEKTTFDISTSTLKRAIERIRAANFTKHFEYIQYHLYFWNSTRTLLKPQCTSLCINNHEIWTEKKEVTYYFVPYCSLSLCLKSVHIK